MKRITLDRLAEVLDDVCLNPENYDFDTKKALEFLSDFGFLKEDRIASPADQSVLSEPAWVPKSNDSERTVLKRDV